MTIPELVDALGITGVRKFGKLSVRTAKAIQRELRRRFDQQSKQYHAILSSRRPQIPIKKIPTKQPTLLRRILTVDNTYHGLRRPKPNLIRKMGVNTEHTAGLIVNAFRVLAFQTDGLLQETGSAIVSIRLRRLRAELQRYRRRTRRSRARRRLEERRRRRQRRVSERNTAAGENNTTATPRPRVRRIRGGRPVQMKFHTAFPVGTIRFSDGRRAKLKRGVRSTRSASLSPYSYRYSRGWRRGSVLRRVRVEQRGTEAARRRAEMARVWRLRRREAERLEATVESWLNAGTGAGAGGGIGF